MVEGAGGGTLGALSALKCIVHCCLQPSCTQPEVDPRFFQGGMGRSWAFLLRQHSLLPTTMLIPVSPSLISVGVEGRDVTVSY